MLAALALLPLLGPRPAFADEFDWVYFPMYSRDASHAVHLSALKFRPDGLLSAATRYPRHGADGWDAKAYQAAWYTYSERLIDCETGVYVDLTDSLLAQDGSKLTSKASTRAEQLEGVERVLLESTSQGWPNNSDIFLACAAASSPTFRRQRAARAAQPLPLWSERPLTDVLAEETNSLSAAKHMHYDFKRIEKQPGASAVTLFEDMRSQYLRWLKSVNGAYAPKASTAPVDQKALLGQVNLRLEQLGQKYAALKNVTGSVIEYTWADETPVLDLANGGATYTLDTRRADCDYGIAVSIRRQKLARGGPTGAITALTARAVLAEIMQRYGEQNGNDGDGPFGGFHLDAPSREICRAIAQLPDPHDREQVAEAAESDEAALPYGLKHESLSQASTPEAMLLAVRAARRSHAR